MGGVGGQGEVEGEVERSGDRGLCRCERHEEDGEHEDKGGGKGRLGSTLDDYLHIHHIPLCFNQPLSRYRLCHSHIGC